MIYENVYLGQTFYDKYEQIDWINLFYKMQLLSFIFIIN